MEILNFSNSNIDLACEEVGKFLASSGVERREALRIKLTFEEVLLEYQSELGEEAVFQLRCVKRFSAIRVEIIVPGKAFDPLDKTDEEKGVIQGLLAGMGLAPTWNYKGGKNFVVFTPKRKPLSGTMKMVAAIALALVCGLLLNLLPQEHTAVVNDYFLSPVADAFMGLISAVSGPLVFLSVLGSICSMGNMETLGKIGSKTIKIILRNMLTISVFMTGLALLFFKVEWGSGETSGFSQILSLIYDIVPSNLLEPFVTGNAMQLIFIAIMMGLAMLVLSTGVNKIFSLVEQIGYIVQTIMSGLSSLLPILIFFLFTGMIAGGIFSTRINPLKMVVVVGVLFVVFYVVNILRIAIVKKISPVLLFKKALPTLIIALTTASSAAAFGTSVRDAEREFGIDKRIANFGIPLGQVLFKPADVAILIAMELAMAEVYGIPITSSFIMTALITNLLLSFSVPPVPGGAVMCYTISLATLGIPMEAMGVILALDVITDFPATACNVSSCQLTLIEVADSLNMLNKEKLHKTNKKSTKLNKAR